MIITGKVSNSRLQAINYFVNSLFSKQLARHIAVRFQFSKKLDCLGITNIEDYNSKNKAREFLIEINSTQTEIEVLRTIAHELVHCAQYATGRLNEDMTVWCGKKVPSNLSYDKQPWEIEAFSVGDILCMEYSNETIRT